MAALPGESGGGGVDPDAVDDIDPRDLMSRLIFRAHPEMVRAAWVRGRRLDGPAAEVRWARRSEGAGSDPRRITILG